MIERLPQFDYANLDTAQRLQETKHTDSPAASGGIGDVLPLLVSTSYDDEWVYLFAHVHLETKNSDKPHDTIQTIAILYTTILNHCYQGDSFVVKYHFGV